MLIIDIADQLYSLLVILMNMVLRLPPHEVASEWEDSRVHCTPGDEHTKIKANPRMEIEKNLSAPFHYIM